jgi:hypothetical protein
MAWDEKKYRELEAAMISEGFTPEEARKGAAEFILRRPDQVDGLLASTREWLADRRRQAN